jgi:hypothetical protein
LSLAEKKNFNKICTASTVQNTDYEIHCRDIRNVKYANNTESHNTLSVFGAAGPTSSLFYMLLFKATTKFRITLKKRIKLLGYKNAWLPRGPLN